MDLNAIHTISFNMHILFSLILGIWGMLLALRNQSISGNYWGSVATSTIVAGVVLLLGVIMTLQGLRPQRIVTYYLYMLWLVIIMPGLYSLLRGRDDRSAALAFSVLSFFNAATSISMFQRSIIGPWSIPEV
jgi:hypothetical protein